jgi:hypothetical protein
MSDKPPAYSEATGPATVVVTQTHGPRLQPPDVNYVKSVCGIAKIIQAVVSLIGFIIGLAVYFGGVSFVNFSTITMFINAVIWFILHVTHAIPQILANYYIELIIYVITDLYLFISAIVAAASGWIDPAIGALSFFCFADTVACSVDLMLQVIDIRQKFANHSESSGAAVITQ